MSAVVPSDGIATVQNQGVGPAYQSADTSNLFGEVQAKGLERGADQLAQGADQVEQLVLRQQQLQNETTATQMDVNFATTLRNATTGDGTDANPGFYNMHGQDAVNAYPATVQQISDARDQLLANAPNPQVAKMLAGASANRMDLALQRMGMHKDQQMTIAGMDASTARVQLAIQDAATNWNDPTTLAQSNGIINAEAVKQATLKGGGDDMIASIKQSLQSTMLHDVIMARAPTDTPGAEAMFTQYKDNIEMPARNALYRELKSFETAAREQSRFDQEAADRAQLQGAKTALDNVEKQVIAYNADPAANPLPPGLLQSISSDHAFDAEPSYRGQAASLLMGAMAPPTDAAISHSTAAGFASRMWLPEGAPGKLTDMSEVRAAFGKGDLSKDDYNFLQSQFTNATGEDGVKLSAIKNPIMTRAVGQLMATPGMGLPDPNRNINAMQFEGWVADREQQFLKEGKDPTTLYKPILNGKANPDFVGAPENLAPYLRDMSDILTSATASFGLKDALPAPNDNGYYLDLSPAQYEKLPHGASYTVPGNPRPMVKP